MDALDAIGNPGLRRRWSRPWRRQAVSIDEVAAARGVHRTVARRRLERLTAAGLLAADFEPRTGRGGPGRVGRRRSTRPRRSRPRSSFRSAATPSSSGSCWPRSRRPARRRRRPLRDDACGRRRREPVADPRRGLERLCDALGSLAFQMRLESPPRPRRHRHPDLPSPPARRRESALPADVDRGPARARRGRARGRRPGRRELRRPRLPRAVRLVQDRDRSEARLRLTAVTVRGARCSEVRALATASRPARRAARPARPEARRY